MFTAKTLAVGIVSCALGAIGARMLPVSAAEQRQQPPAPPAISVKAGPDGVTLVADGNSRLLVVQGISEPGKSTLLRRADRQAVIPNKDLDTVVVYRYTDRFFIGPKDHALHPCGPDGHCPPAPPCPPGDPDCPLPLASIRVLDLLRMPR